MMTLSRNKWCVVLLAIMMCVVTFFVPVKVNAEEENFVLGESMAISALFCDTKEQLVSILNETEKNGLEVAGILLKEMLTPQGRPVCGIGTFKAVVEEVVEPFVFGTESGNIVRVTITGVVTWSPHGYGTRNIPPLEQYLWSTTEIVKRGIDI